jgi:FemAB-related protein (PEP-CTERM system-associated)
MNFLADDSMVSAQAMAPLQVRCFAPADASNWDAFVEQCSDATFFHRIGWKEILERCFGHKTHYLVAERASRIVGVLPLAEVKSLLFGHFLLSIPFCIVGGAAASERAAIDLLHKEAQQLAERLGVDYLELRNRACREQGWPQQDLYVSFRKEMLLDVEANMRAIPRKQRAMVRKGINNGLTSRVDSQVEDFFSLYADNVHRHGTPPLPKRYFQALCRVFGRDAEILTIADATGNVVSSVLSFYFKDEVLPYYAGDSVEARELAANDFKYWELMRRACERGVRVFDYGRSKRGTGSFDFKKNWGFEPVPLAYEYKLYRRDSIPENNPLNPRYRALIALWRKLPLPVANFLGPLVVKSLG